jgi:hypothetical protein
MLNSFNAESKRLLIFSLEKFKNQKLVHKKLLKNKYDPRNVNISYTIIRKER